MSKFFIRWHVDNFKMPATLEETGKLFISMLETVEAGLHTGKLKAGDGSATDGTDTRLVS